MGQVSTIGLDTAKRVFQVHGVGAPHAPRARTNAAMRRPSNPLKFLSETLAALGTLSRSAGEGGFSCTSRIEW